MNCISKTWPMPNGDFCIKMFRIHLLQKFTANYASLEILINIKIHWIVVVTEKTKLR